MSKSTAQLVINYERDRNCSICFGQIKRRCMTDWCRHHFCLECLMRWSEEHNYCPECRQVFKAILCVNDLRHENDFDVFIIENEETIRRKTLITRSDHLKNAFLKEIERRIDLINGLKSSIAGIEQECHQIEDYIRKVDTKFRKNNVDFEQHLNQITQNLQNFQSIAAEANDGQNGTHNPPAQQNAGDAQPANSRICGMCWIKSIVEGIVNCAARCLRFKIKWF